MHQLWHIGLLLTYVTFVCTAILILLLTWSETLLPTLSKTLLLPWILLVEFFYGKLQSIELKRNIIKSRDKGLDLDLDHQAKSATTSCWDKPASQWEFCSHFPSYLKQTQQVATACCRNCTQNNNRIIFVFFIHCISIVLI